MSPIRATKSGLTGSGTSLASTALLGKLIHGDPAHYFEALGKGLNRAVGRDPNLDALLLGSLSTAGAGAAKGVGMDMLMSTRGAQQLKKELLKKLGR